MVELELRCPECKGKGFVKRILTFKIIEKSKG